jgi:hypothetical protein
MKKLNVLLLFTMIAAALTFTSCSDDETTTTDCNDNGCPAGFECDAASGNCIEIVDDSVVTVESNITDDTTWETGKCYILAGRIAVENGATLTIQEGVVVKGQAGAGANATALLVARGGTLNANGTAALPIVFTSVADEITPADLAAGNYASPNLDPNVNGLWGGVIVLGNAPISAQNENDQDVSEINIEGIPTSDPNGLYGGSDAADNSGTISYISIRHGGTNIGAGNEINGLTLGGVGSGTSISNVEVVANQDDGVEWFGGTVSVSNVVVWNCGDDGLDTDQAWNGTCSNFAVVTPQGGSGFELDGPEGSLTQGCNAFENGVLYAGADIDHLVDWDGSTNTGITDLYIFGIDEEYPADGFEPIESFGGDGQCTSGNWQITLPAGGDVATILNGVPGGAITEVAVGSQTVGPNASDFAWTFAGDSGALASIGL